MVLNSYAKLNLYLEVLDKRPDNYHNLSTLFERIDLCDKIILKKRADRRITLTTNSSEIPGDSSNLAFRAALLLQKKNSLNQGVDIKIIKRIPVGSGMGGGSSNAATVLMGLNKLWRLKLSKNKLAGYAREIGADVPFFIYETSFAEACDRGDKIKPLKSLSQNKFWHILVVPRINVSTPLIFKLWDELKKAKIYQNHGLTLPISNVKMLTSALSKNDLFLISKTLFNSLEQVSISAFPQIRQVKDRLALLGLKSSLMSGSGPTVFSFVASRREALALNRQLKNFNSWQVFLVKTK